MRSVVVTLLALVAVQYAIFAGLRYVSSGILPRPLAALVARLDDVVDKRFRIRRRGEPLPVVLLELELRRLAADIRRIETSDLPHKAARLMAARAAYDGVLLDLCRRNHIPMAAAAVPLSHGARFQAEEALISAGHGW